MGNFKLLSKVLIFIVVILAVFQEAECRRKILKGRKAITRSYIQDLGIPAWAIILLVGLGQLIIGAVLFVILKLIILDPPIKTLLSLSRTSSRRHITEESSP